MLCAGDGGEYGAGGVGDVVFDVRGRGGQGEGERMAVSEPGGEGEEEGEGGEEEERGGEEGDFLIFCVDPLKNESHFFAVNIEWKIKHRSWWCLDGRLSIRVTFSYSFEFCAAL